MNRTVGLFTLLLVATCASPRLLCAQAPKVDAPPPAFKVEVIGTTPLPGVDLRLEDIPSPVQTALQRDIDASGALDLADFLNRRINGVFINEMQGNPFQPDVNYRGFTASPLLGTPQGLSVYMDGVRLNQAFGDVVSWDLIPRIAIASIALMPGSNPLFGLNTLGGALSIQTKDGRDNLGTSVQAIYGSHARRAVEFEHGGSRSGGLDWYLAGNLFAEDGWREASPSNVGQLFGKLGWHDAKTDLTLSGSYADNSLTGNGLQEQRRRLHRLSDQRRERLEHAVSVLAMHRAGVVERRAGREVQRAAQHHAHDTAQLRPVRSADGDRESGRPSQSIHCRRRLRRQSRRLSAVDPAGLSESRPQHHRRGRLW
jgi:outer membrane receptor protein involved in Fe transport